MNQECLFLKSQKRTSLVCNKDVDDCPLIQAAMRVVQEDWGLALTNQVPSGGISRV
jgi:hypothetical protein